MDALMLENSMLKYCVKNIVQSMIDDDRAKQVKKKKSDGIPRRMALVKFDFDNLHKKYHSDYPFNKNQRLIFMGEIPNMPGHCVLMDAVTTKLYSGYHTENFKELMDDET